MKEVKTHAKNGPIRVLFPISGSMAKWKMQPLYEAMSKSRLYEPIMALTCYDIESATDLAEKRDHAEQLRMSLKKKAVNYVEAYDWENDKALSFEKFHPDIVWYQNPWQISPIQMPFAVSKYALTCYVPYFVQNYGGLEMDCETLFHRELWRHFTLNEAWAKVFMADQGCLLRSGRTVGVGHPMLDQFLQRRKKNFEKRYIIYAPHWSCGIGECFSTFLKYGRKILDLAKRHTEIEWVFKPHPTLRFVLIKYHLMNEQDVDKYYAEWERLGTICLDGDYADLFMRAKAMITDCASFLVEFACTESPIIHLISSDAKFQPHPISEKLFRSYYQVKDWEAFESAFNTVIIDGNDFKKQQRIEEIEHMKLIGNNATENILGYLDGTING